MERRGSLPSSVNLLSLALQSHMTLKEWPGYGSSRQTMYFPWINPRELKGTELHGFHSCPNARAPWKMCFQGPFTKRNGTVMVLINAEEGGGEGLEKVQNLNSMYVIQQVKRGLFYEFNHKNC